METHRPAGAVITTTVALGPVATLFAMISASGSQWLHPTLLPWAMVAVAILWCPFLPASASAIILGEWRDAMLPGVRGWRRALGLPKAMLASPIRTAVLANTASWFLVAGIALGALYAG